ncbi:peptidoglycan-associated lipoprotein Pal [Helicobacter anatolicus]|uniref:peptidoglycan-associated lipoprotein Pal n=1 Tax=Helicobacter anatolicus TaxID=2905874 RepID=UPI001E32513D|nr:peptidoglycan-associated lipoprotein Pal [Helicobacter anatolicus]MCE3037855.1 peptidoglycan-associated lipoprotein Pal [Helicobacter anatolicus]
MKKIIFSLFVVLFIVGCAKKEIAINEESAMVEEEPIETNIAEVQEVEKKDVVEDGSIIGSIYFDYDKFDIRQDMVETLDDSVEKINDNPEMSIVIEGNTDEFGSDEYNFALSNRRALAVQKALNTRGVAKDKISIVSFGKTKPVCMDKSEECYQKNRRGDIRLIK